MKSTTILVLLLVSAAACSFDRTPVRLHTAATSGSRPAAELLDAETTLPDTGTDSEDAGPSEIADAAPEPMPIEDAALPTPDAGDGGGTVVDPPPAPDVVRCGQVFCAAPDNPATACCTSDADVKTKLARDPGVCGVNMRGVDAKVYGSGCWQRDRLGIVDDRCPKVGSDLGCCSEDGFCGINNAEQHLGCRHTLGADLRACGEETPVESCDPRGAYGIRVTIDTTWDGRTGGLTALTDDGRGLIQIYLWADIEKANDAAKDIMVSSTLCGVTLPPFYSSTLCESYQPVFPLSLWEAQSVPRPALGGHYECGTQGCVLNLGPTTYLFGVHLDNPEAPWPTAAQTAGLRCESQPEKSCFPDHDDDGWPGIQVDLTTSGKAPATTSRCSSGYGYRAAPLSESVAAIINGVRRADRLMLGIRARIGGALRFDEKCQGGQGTAIAQYVNSRADGCLVQQGTFDLLQTTPAGPKESCTSKEAKFIDESMPTYHVLSAGEAPATNSMRLDGTPSKGPVISMVRFGASHTFLTCDQVRAASY